MMMVRARDLIASRQQDVGDLVDTYPLDFNGYVAVARPALRIAASEVRDGDLLLLDGFISKVTNVQCFDLAVRRDTVPAPWPVIKISGSVNIVRFPHEAVSVIRA